MIAEKTPTDRAKEIQAQILVWAQIRRWIDPDP